MAFILCSPQLQHSHRLVLLLRILCWDPESLSKSIQFYRMGFRPTIHTYKVLFAMNILGHVVILLLLGEAVSQNRRNSKSNSKVPNQGKKTLNPAGEPVPAASNDDTFPVESSSVEDSKDTTVYQLTNSNDDMKLYYLKNTQVTCNDGTTAGFYLREHKGSRRWQIFLEGGWCCYNKETCDSRYKNIRRLMSSSEWPQTRKGSGILSAQSEENPHWWNANTVFIPYCSSDVWSGTSSKSRQGKETAEYAFMGSLIIREVIKDLVPKGIKQAKVVMLSGASAGGTGVLLNIEKVSGLMEQLGADAQVRGLVDSGWFLESKQQRSTECSDTASCTPTDAIKKGLRLWNGVIPEKCRQQFKRGEEWQCFFGHKLYSSLKSPVFVVQWLFDEEQLRVENIQLGSHSLTEHQWTYIQNLGRELKISFQDVPAVFAPACLSHTLITKSNWLEFQVKGTSLSRALQCWDKSLQDTSKNSKASVKGCPFHLIDNCQWPQCNPTCPALLDHTTGQEVSLLQVLMGMGLDLQKVAQELKIEVSHLLGMISNGG
ncbi:carboxylesterase notum2-like [Huso huso]|uniref:Carboxylesterase notum2-like n=1 Tax=Huso huso TaxID=61971 RepID=A0ABR0YU66_HUSHU